MPGTEHAPESRAAAWPFGGAGMLFISIVAAVARTAPARAQVAVVTRAGRPVYDRSPTTRAAAERTFGWPTPRLPQLTAGRPALSAAGRLSAPSAAGNAATSTSTIRVPGIMCGTDRGCRPRTRRGSGSANPAGRLVPGRTWSSLTAAGLAGRDEPRLNAGQRRADGLPTPPGRAGRIDARTSSRRFPG